MARPDPIPNSAVKRCIADGSASIGCARVGSRQIYFLKTGTHRSGFFVPLPGVHKKPSPSGRGQGEGENERAVEVKRTAKPREEGRPTSA